MIYFILTGEIEKHFGKHIDLFCFAEREQYLRTLMSLSCLLVALSLPGSPGTPSTTLQHVERLFMNTFYLKCLVHMTKIKHVTKSCFMVSYKGLYTRTVLGFGSSANTSPHYCSRPTDFEHKLQHKSDIFSK